MRTVSIANFKGGTGKSTTAVTMAAELTARGRRVLLIDADPQHNATDFCLGGEDPSPTLTQVLRGETEPYWPDVVNRTGREGLDVIGADMELLGLDLAALRGEGSDAVRRLSGLLDAMREDNAYDFVLIDCPPSFTAASVAALAVADYVILPTKVDRYSVDGVGELVEQLRQIFRGSANAPRHSVLVTMSTGTNLAREGEELLRAAYAHVFRTVIRSTVKVGESSYARVPVTEYAPRCTAAFDYRDFVTEFLQEVGNNG